MNENEMNDLEVSVSHEAKLTKAKQDAIKYIEEFRRASRKVSTRSYDHTENMAFYEGKQYQLSRYKISRPWVVRMRTPYASIAIDTRVSSLIASDYRGKLVPMKPDNLEAVETINKFMGDEWERMNMNTKINECIKTSAIVRESYIHLVWNEKGDNDGSIEAYAIDMPSSVYIDPTALSLRDARYVSVATRKNIDAVKEEYPEFYEDIKRSGSTFVPDDRGEVYLGSEYNSDQEGVVTMLTHYRKEKGAIHKYIILEDILVEEVELDGLTVFPIAQMRWKRSAGSPYGLALMDDLIDLQKAVNGIESAFTNTALSYAAPSYGVKKGSGVDPKQLALTLGIPGMVVAVDGDVDQAIKPLSMPKLDNAVASIMRDYIGAIDRVAGITNPYLGSVGTAGNTEGGTKMALERARIIEADVLHNVELFIEELTTILVQYIASNYSGEEVTSRKVDKATGDVSFNTHNLPDDIDSLEWTFFINLSAKTAYSKEREKEMILELYQMQHQYKDDIKLINQLDVLDAYDLSNKEVLVERFATMTKQSHEEKSQIITDMVASATQLGIDMALVQQAIVELMSASTETPVLDQVMQLLQQKAQESAQLRQETMSQFKQDVTQAGVPEQAVNAMEQQMM